MEISNENNYLELQRRIANEAPEVGVEPLLAVFSS